MVIVKHTHFGVRLLGFDSELYHQLAECSQKSLQTLNINVSVYCKVYSATSVSYYSLSLSLSAMVWIWFERPPPSRLVLKFNRHCKILRGSLIYVV